MKILYIHQYYRTPEEGGAIRSWYLTRALARQGHEVEVITSHNQPRPVTKEIDGITVHYLPVHYQNKFGFTRRVIAFLKFVWATYRKAKNIADVDLVYATSTPLTVGWIALQLKKKLGIPYYFEVRDLWPDAPIRLGFIKNPLLQRYLYRLEKRIYENADRIIALSPGIRNAIERKVPKKQVALIPNMSDTAFFKPTEKDPETEARYNVKGKFVMSYFGAIGRVNQLDYMLDIVRACQDKQLNMHFFVAGEGAALERLKWKAANMGLRNLEFLSYRNKAGIRELLSITDAVYISFARNRILETNSPNKFFDAIAAGKLCVINTKGWIKEIIEKQKAGFYADPTRPGRFADTIAPFIQDRTLLLEYQKNARTLAEQYFSIKIQEQKFLQLFGKGEKLVAIEPSVYTLTA